MLDGLLGRGGFASKCKSLIKISRTRIDVTRRKRLATQKFLKQDVADLLADGLESNAFGRVEGLIAELCLTSCYDFIDHVCEIILKHLSTMQKHGDCPEDCREAVASLMFAAARFSDLPELRDLRNIFQERYGNSLEYFVNPKLVEHINPEPPNMERKLKLLQDIASEFSVNWDSFAFEQKMIHNTPARENKTAARADIHSAKENKYLVPQPKVIVHKIDTDVPIAKRGPEATHQMKGREPLKSEHRPLPGAVGIVQRQHTDRPFHEQELDRNKYKPPINAKAIRKTEDENVNPRRRELMIDEQKSVGQEKGRLGRAGAEGSSHVERAEPVLNQQKISFNGKLKIAPETEHHRTVAKGTVAKGKFETLPVKGEAYIASPSHSKHDKDFIGNPVQKLPEEDTDKLKCSFRSHVPPPYVKPNRSKHRSRHLESHGNGDENDTLTFNPGAENLESVAADIPHFTAVYYKDDISRTDPTPRRRSRRRHKSSSIPSDTESVEEVRVVRRVTTSRRRNESKKKGLQILFDGDGQQQHQRDTEEMMMDKLLLHYSKKPSSAGEPSEKPRRKAKRGSSNANESILAAEIEELAKPPPSRSISLPHEQSSSEFKGKVYTRAVSFDQEASTPVKHVHPKLPDYDDLAARFAALRRNKV